MSHKVGYSHSSSFDSYSNSLSDSEDSGSEFEDIPVLPNLLPKGKEVEGSQPARPQLVLSAQGAPADGAITIEATRRRVHVEIYALHGGKFRQDAGVTDDIEHTVETTFSQFKSALVALSICTADQKVDIDVDNRIVWICNEDGTGVISKDLNTLERAPATQDTTILQAHSEMITSANALKDLASRIWPNAARRPEVSAGRKASETAPSLGLSWVTRGATTGVAPCAKEALKLYEAAGANPTQQENALKRMMAAESMINSMERAIKAELVNRETVLSNARASIPQDAAAIQTAQAAVESLKKHAEVHRLGLYVALAFTSSYDLSSPEAALASADQAAAQIQEVLQKHLNEKHEEMVNKDVYTGPLHELVPDFMRGTPNSLIPKDETYAKWAAALAYSVLSEELARMGVSNYWSREQCSGFKDGIEDELVRFIVRKELQAASEVATPMLQAMLETATVNGIAPANTTVRSLQAAAVAALTSAVPAGETMIARIDAMAAQFA